MAGDLRTPRGSYISFSAHGDDFTMSILHDKKTVHVKLSPANMEELMEEVGRVYYGAIEEDSEDFMVRLMKRAIREERKEREDEEGRQTYQRLKLLGLI